MKLYIENGRIIVKSCSKNLTDIGEHEKIKIIFKPDTITEYTLYIFEFGFKKINIIHKHLQKYYSKLYAGEKYFLNSMYEFIPKFIELDSKNTSKLIKRNNNENSV